MLLPGSSFCLTHPVSSVFSAFTSRVGTCLSFHLLVASVSRSASLLGAPAPLIQNDLIRFRRFSQLCLTDIASWPWHSSGCPFQVTGARTAFLSLRQILFLEIQYHNLYPGINTAIRFVFIASWFLKDSSGLLTAFIGSG